MEMEKRTKILLAILAVVLVIFLVVLFFGMRGYNANDENNYQEGGNGKSLSVVPGSLDELLKKKVGDGYVIKSRELYEGMEKITLNLEGLELLPTTKSEAVVFVKKNEIVAMPEKYAREVALRDIENLKNNGEKDNFNYQGSELESIKFIENFENSDKTYEKNVYVASVKLPSPFPKEGGMIPGDLNYIIIVIDEFGNILFRYYWNNAL